MLHPPRIRHLLLALLCAATAVVTGVAAGTPATAATLYVDYNFVDGIAASLVNPSAAPPGANDWSCKPSANHPRPVVLVHATLSNMAEDFSAISPLLKNNGYCVFALNYGGTDGSLFQALNDIPSSAAQLSAFVERVRSATGATQVDMVGHSQGGMLPRYYLKSLGGAAKVHTLVALAPSNHGTTLDGITALESELGALGTGITSVISSACTACTQQIAGSPFMTALNAGGDTVPGVSYTVIETKNDEVITPYTSAFLTGSTVTNIRLQDRCLLDQTDHLGIADDIVALHLMLNALDPAHPQLVPCVPVLPIFGG